MARKDVEKALQASVLALASSDGYSHVKDDYIICAKDIEEGVRCFLSCYLTDKYPPYSVESKISCEYTKASQIIAAFIKSNDIQIQANVWVGLYSVTERYTKTKSVQRVSEQNIDQVAHDLYERFKEGVENLILPRVHLKTLVDEYLTKPHYKWPMADLLQCCLATVSYGLLERDIAIAKKGMSKVFETLNKPNSSQMHKDFFEAMAYAVDHNF